jgi:hypothetical protein
MTQPTVLVVANRLEVAVHAYEHCKSLYGVKAYIKESNSGYGFVVYTFDCIERIKYDLSHMF